MEMIEQLEVNPDMPKSDLAAVLGDRLEFDKELASLSSFKTGGKADFFYAVTNETDITTVISTCQQNDIPFFIIGGGSNLLISDNGFRGLIIKVDIKGITMISDTTVVCGAGENLMSLIDFTAEQGLTGFEFASGIWGSVGGAVYGNAGAYGGEIKDLITEIRLADLDGNIRNVSPEYCRFGYRDSYLKHTGEIVLSITVQLQKGNRQEIRKKIDEIIKIRSEKHPVDGMCAGSFFKNIPDKREKYGKLPAGRLLEEVGAKNLSVGGAKVFEKHANIIINDGTATSKDIRELADIMKKKVYEKFGITLEEEVISVGKFK